MNKNKTIDHDKSGLIFFLLVISATTFAYYQGRSHSMTFYSILPMVMMAMGVFVHLLKKANLNFHSLSVRVIISFFAFIFVYNSFEFMYSMNRHRKYSHQRIYKNLSYQEEADRNFGLVSLYQKHSPTPRKILIVSHGNESYYLSRLWKEGIRPINNVSFVDIFLQSQFDRIIQDISSYQGYIFIEPGNQKERVIEAVNKFYNKVYSFCPKDYTVCIYSRHPIDHSLLTPDMYVKR